MSDVLYDLVDSQRTWDRALKFLSRAPRLAVDLEANSLYAYRERICLIQISTETQNFIIDPLAEFSLEPLKHIFESASIEKVFHAAEYDLSLLENLYGWRLSNFFDTMWAGRLLGFSKMGLAWFLETLYGIHLDKKHQKANWAQRPLSPEKLLYACNDTCHLLRLRDDLGKQLEEKGLLREAEEVFRNLCRPHGAKRVFNADDFWKLPGARTIPPRAQAVLKALFVFRENEAKRRDVPPFKVMNNQVLVQIAQASARWNGNMPRKITSIPGVSDKLLDRLHPRLDDTIRKALHATPPVYSTRHQNHSAGYWQRHELLLQWRKETAGKRGVESDAILNRETLEEIAEKWPQKEQELASINTLGPCKREQYGAEIIKILNQ